MISKVFEVRRSLRLETLSQRLLFAGDGVQVDQQSSSSSEVGNAIGSLSTQQVFDREDFLRQVAYGPSDAGQTISFGNIVLVVSGNTVTSFLTQNDITRQVDHISFNATGLTLRSVDNQLFVSGVKQSELGKILGAFYSVWKVSEIGHLAEVDRVDAGGRSESSAENIRKLFETNVSYSRGNDQSIGEPLINFRFKEGVELQNWSDYRVVFGSLDGLGDLISVRSDTRLTARASDNGFALVMPEHQFDRPQYLLKATGNGGERIASLQFESRLEAIRELKALPNDNLEVFGSFRFENDARSAWGTAIITNTGEVIQQPVEIATDIAISRIRKQLAIGNTNEAGNVRAARHGDAVVITDLRDDQTSVQTVNGIDGRAFGEGIVGDGGVNVGDDGSVIVLSAFVDEVIRDPKPNLGRRGETEFPVTATLLKHSSNGIYTITDVVSLGSMPTTVSSEFLTQGILTLRNPDGRVVTVVQKDDKLSVEFLKASANDTIIRMPDVLIHIADDEIQLLAPESLALESLHDEAVRQVVPFDVNNDGKVTALDALLVINYLNAKDSVGESEPVVQTSGNGYRLDVNDDGVISALDALQVINQLNSSLYASEPVSPQPEVSRGEREDDQVLGVESKLF